MTVQLAPSRRIPVLDAPEWVMLCALAGCAVATVGLFAVARKIRASL